MDAELELSHDTGAARYQAQLDGAVVSHIAYRLDGDALVVVSTVTAPEHRGAGYAGRLTRFALDDARARGLRVVPQCPYTANWIRSHPDYGDLIG